VSGHIERRRRGLYAVVEVPPSLRREVGRKRLRKTLATSDATLARHRLASALADLHAVIAAAKRRRNGGSAAGLVTSEPAAMYETAATTGDGGLAIDHHLEDWLASLTHAPRTIADHRRAVARLCQWPRFAGMGPRLARVDRRLAGAFVEDLATPQGRHWTGDGKTVRKYLSSLSGYWRWLQAQGLVVDNPWLGHKLSAPAAGRPTRSERAFTDAELQLLLSTAADPPLLHDLIVFGALTGARLEAIVGLRVKDCIGGNFRFRAEGGRHGARLVPIHPALQPIVQHRAQAKRLDAYLFEEAGPQSPRRERSMGVGKRFGRLLRSKGLVERLPGRRRSLVNFESLRRWFAEKAAAAGQPEPVIAAILGHRHHGMTIHSAGPGSAQLRACIAAINLPA
jgi:integrase